MSPSSSLQPDLEESRRAALDRLNEVRDELRAAQWQAAQAWQHPPPPRQPGPGAVWRSLKRDGLRMTLKKISARVSARLQ